MKHDRKEFTKFIVCVKSFISLNLFTVIGKDDTSMFLQRRSSQVIIESVVLADFSRLARRNPYSYLDKWDYGVVLPSGTAVYNARGSAGDIVKIEDGNTYRSMIQLWRELTGDNVKCYNANCKNYFLDVDIPVDGAHVLLRKTDKELQIGDLVFIIPLCHTCNTSIHPCEPIILKNDVKAVALNWNGKTVQK